MNSGYHAWIVQRFVAVYPFSFVSVHCNVS